MEHMEPSSKLTMKQRLCQLFHTTHQVSRELGGIGYTNEGAPTHMLDHACNCPIPIWILIILLKQTKERRERWWIVTISPHISGQILKPSNITLNLQATSIQSQTHPNGPKAVSPFCRDARGSRACPRLRRRAKQGHWCHPPAHVPSFPHEACHLPGNHLHGWHQHIGWQHLTGCVPSVRPRGLRPAATAKLRERHHSDANQAINPNPGSDQRLPKWSWAVAKLTFRKAQSG